MISNYFGVDYRNKTTGNIVTLHSRGWSSKGNTVTYYDGEGLPNTISEQEFDSKFEPEVIDYRKYKDNIAEACHLNRDFQRLANVLLKRLDPDYLKKGAIVYFEHPEGYFKKDNGGYIDYGSDKPYEIVDIVPDRDGRNLCWVKVIRKGKNPNSSGYFDEDFKLPIYYDRLEPNDAHWNLKRYDKPY